MRITSLLVSLLALLCSTPSFARAADVAFFPVETTNLVPADSYAVGELLAQAYAGVSRQAVLAPSRTQDVLATAVTYEAAAQQLGVTEFVRTSAVGVGRKIVIQATRYQSNGQVVFVSKMTAEAIEDMPAVSDRMARALYELQDDELVRTHHNVTLNEARPKSRMWSEKVIGVKTGVHMPFAKDSKFVPNLSLAFDMRLEHEKFFLEFGVGAIIPTEVQDDECFWGEDDYECRGDKDGRIGGLTAEFGASGFLTDGDVGLYAGGGFIPRLGFSEDDLAEALAYGQFGVMLPREASTRFYADVRLAQYMTSIHLDNGKERHPTELALHVGIGW